MPVLSTMPEAVVPENVPEETPVLVSRSVALPLVKGRMFRGLVLLG
jgi:hypothetical protein